MGLFIFIFLLCALEIICQQIQQQFQQQKLGRAVVPHLM